MFLFFQLGYLLFSLAFFLEGATLTRFHVPWSTRRLALRRARFFPAWLVGPARGWWGVETGRPSRDPFPRRVAAWRERGRWTWRFRLDRRSFPRSRSFPPETSPVRRRGFVAPERSAIHRMTFSTWGCQSYARFTWRERAHTRPS